MMDVFRIRDGELTTLFNRSKIYLHSLRLSDGDKFIIDMGEVVFGPVTIVEHNSQSAIIQVDEDFNYYYDTDADVIELSKLKSILMPYEYYESVTGNIYLDGFLRAAYIDDDGLVIVYISDSLKGLVDYYSKAMDVAGINYHKIENSFVIDDVEVVSAVFDNWMERLPPKYVVGYMSSFILGVKLYTHNNPLYSRYQFILGDGYEPEVATDSFFVMIHRSQHVMYSLFGNMEPLRSLIDEIVDENKEDIEICNYHPKADYGVGELIYQKLAVMLFDYSGYHPEYTDGGSAIFVRKDKYDDRELIKITFSKDSIDSDYYLEYNRGDLILSKIENRALSQSHSLFYSNIFDFGVEMRSYFEIIFKKL